MELGNSVVLLLSIGVAMFAGLMVSRITRKFNLPAVTAYLVAGVIIGPHLLGGLLGNWGIKGIGFNSEEQVKSLEIISQIALGFIAFAIGNEFRVKNIKEIGKPAFVIGVLQAFAATI